MHFVAPVSRGSNCEGAMGYKERDSFGLRDATRHEPEARAGPDSYRCRISGSTEKAREHRTFARPTAGSAPSSLVTVPYYASSARERPGPSDRRTIRLRSTKIPLPEARCNGALSAVSAACALLGYLRYCHENHAQNGQYGKHVQEELDAVPGLHVCSCLKKGSANRLRHL